MRASENTPIALWAAVYATALCAGVLVAGEFLPVSLLSPIAQDFVITEGRAGQAISISGLFAVLTSLTIAPLTRRIDRRHVVTGFVFALALSCVIVGFATTYPWLLAGRAVLGVAVGGFWTFATATVMRLLPPQHLAAGLALVSSGIAVATTFSAPLASILGELLGWRNTVLLMAPVAGFAGIGLWTSLPAMPPDRAATGRNPFGLFHRRQVRLAMAAVALVFLGQFAIFTYIRPFLESVTGLSVRALSGVLLGLGMAGIAGTWWVGRALKADLFRPLITLPLVLALIAAGLVVFGSVQWAVAALFIAWGFVGSAAPVGWGLWLSRALPEDAEVAGGLQVAVIQLAIAAGALSGGMALDHLGWQAPFWVGIACLVGSAGFAALTAADMRRSAPAQ